MPRPPLPESSKKRLLKAIQAQAAQSRANLEWLVANLNPYFFLTMAEEEEAVTRLAEGLHTLASNRRLVLAENEEKLILACENRPGSLYGSLRELSAKRFSYAELTHSYGAVPGTPHQLEVQRFEFRRKGHREIAAAPRPDVPAGIRGAVRQALARLYPDYPLGELAPSLELLWLNNEHYCRISPPERVARLLWLYLQGRRHEGLFLDAENTEDVVHHRESRLVFSVGNPPEEDFLAQVVEVFNRLEIGVRRAYCVILNTGVHPYLLGTFYVTTRDDALVQRDSDLFRRLKAELYNTQILPTSSRTYADFVTGRLMAGEDASLTNALAAFCHTNLAHAQPDRFDLPEVRRAFQTNPELSLALCRVFRARFDPDAPDREASSANALAAVEADVEGYNTGHRHLDEIRRTVFRTALLFIRHTLKTNFFVPEKHALAFRLDPAYLAELGPDFTSDLPPAKPFRVTFFSGRYGAGYHVGFSDIARGGWRTILCRTPDDFLTNANTVLREVTVLAHTQHLKNKDIYEGGSKMVVVLDASNIEDPDDVEQRLYKLQFGFTNAFLDLFVTEGGRARNPRVVDYYGQDEPVELGPDENMHDAMIELIARQAQKRGYVLGKGLISSKRIGINHKEYGVTSRGVVSFAEVTLGELGIDVRRDPFTVKLTGGPNGDVAGNALKLLLERCPRMKVVLVVAGSGALYDPEGIDREELGRLVLQKNIDDFDPAKLHTGAFLLSQRRRRHEGLRELFPRVARTESALEERWVSSDDFHREFEGLVFDVPADLFLPCGGRPETIDAGNWERLFPGGAATCRAIVEGANSFVTPAARTEIQRRGVVVVRDASANKCGVISSSYEIIANLMLEDDEFLAHKDAYVADVLAILEKRAREEALLLFRRRRESGGRLLYTEISDGLSGEINGHYGRLFGFLSGRPDLVDSAPFRRVLLAHLPAFLSQQRKYRARVTRLPFKVRCAILAAEIATRIVYGGGWEEDFETALKRFVAGPALSA